MGRPLNKKYFGNPATAGLQLTVVADLGNGPVNAWIVEQVGTRRYIMTDGTNTATCTLVNVITGPGEAVMTVNVSGGGTETARIVQAHRVKTFEGSNLGWSFDPPMGEYSQLPSA